MSPGAGADVRRHKAHVRAQAKVNLALRVLAREASGYHQVETVLARIGLCDEVRVRLTNGARTLVCTGRLPRGGLGPVEQNLAWRAAVAYQEATGFPAGFAIEVEKRIPVGGGLGGGSADAGAVLRGLNALNVAPLPPDRLLRLAGTLGADVPFLTQDVAPRALAWGRGDRMVLLPPLPERPVLLFVPPAAVATADAYRWIDAHAVAHAAVALAPSQLDSWSGVAAMAANDFEAVVADRVPVIGQILGALRGPDLRGAIGEDGFALMSGSGSAVFVVLGAEGDAGSRIVEAMDPSVRPLATRTATFVEPVVLIN